MPLVAGRAPRRYATLESLPMWKIATGLVVAAIVSATLAAQDPPNLVSPDVRADRTVVFRLWAPRATDVQLSGSWMGPQPPAVLTKGADGVWTVTIGPLTPNVYAYGFLVDGVRATDPSCRQCGLMWARRAASTTFTIPDTPSQSWERRHGPAGTLHHEQFHSGRQQAMRRYVVYTPPDYDPAGARRYPVLVLLPGTPGDETDWTSGGGLADVMFDNLIADGRMVPMVVVMHASDVLEPRDGRRGDVNLKAFETILLDELLPIVRKRYRVSDDPRSWAIAGLSLGGEFGMHVGLRHPETFRTVASISGSLVESSFEERFPLADPRRLAADYRLIWIGGGSDDIFFGGAKAFASRLASAGVPHVFKEFPGAHVMPVFRHELNDLLPRLFKE